MRDVKDSLPCPLKYNSTSSLRVFLCVSLTYEKEQDLKILVTLKKCQIALARLKLPY